MHTRTHAHTHTHTHRDSGASPRALAGELSALMTCCTLESSTKKRLADVRAFIYRNRRILEEPLKWTGKQNVLQLASQEAVMVFGVKDTGERSFVDLINKREFEKNPHRFTYHAVGSVQAVCFSPHGSKLVWADGLNWWCATCPPLL